MGPTKRSTKPKVSIIIPIRPKEDISLTRKALKDSTYKNFELIVVDTGQERSKQRNIGIKQAKGEYLLVLDSDQIPAPGLIELCVKCCDHDGYDALYLAEEIIARDWFARIRNWDRQFFNGTAVDCVRFVRRKGCPLFDEDMSGPEDSDWDRRVKGKRLSIDDICLYHNDGVSFSDFFQKKAYYSKSMKRFAARNPGDKVLNPYWRLFKVYFENGKWMRVRAHPLKFLTVMGMNFIRGVVYLWCR